MLRRRLHPRHGRTPSSSAPHYSKAEGSSIPDYKDISLSNVRVLAGRDLKQVVTLMGYDAEHMLDVSLDNVVVEGNVEVKAAYAGVKTGPNPVSFTASGEHVDFANGVTAKTPPNPCTGKFGPLGFGLTRPRVLERDGPIEHQTHRASNRSPRRNTRAARTAPCRPSVAPARLGSSRHPVRTSSEPGLRCVLKSTSLSLRGFSTLNRRS